jgi:hypothetical protein
MRQALRWLGLCVFLATTSLAAEGKRKAMPIAGEWNLSGMELSRAKTEGKRVVQLIAKGDARLKKGRNSLLGPWTLVVSAEVIECDFPGKRFIARGPYKLVQESDGLKKMEIEGTAANSSVELLFHGQIKAEGPNTVRMLDAPPKNENRKAAEKKPPAEK